ncbi:hypothetical protein N0V93_003248 [Gnomoniopsis smithogilvyi]|uniref:Ribophorin II C-terminal domain-containing protein n=1 Tax=Gnomoniopsis smithogilvyi TaxID=1191159 RepID=A0A9W9CYY8_9PEZI|nr:hypothetical protein N0V93_003248 [Gnomoniopsis smithogilvyi]
MRVTGISSLLLLAAGAVQAASSWSFDDGAVSISNKKGGEADKQTFGPTKPLTAPIPLGAQDTLTVFLTAKDNGKAKRPHQAFILLKDQETGLEAPFPLSVRDTGKGKVQITQKDIPTPFFASSKPIHATVVIGSFGSAQGIIADAFDVEIALDANTPPPAVSAPLRYVKQPQIHHIFKEQAKYPPTVIPLAFVGLILVTLPVAAYFWFVQLGANFSHLPKALKTAPISHTTFLASIFGMEFVYFLYHRGLSLGHIILPVTALGAVMVFSGMKALGEVQSRRLAGER